MGWTQETWRNNASGTVSSGGTDAPSSGTVETFTVSGYANFPTASSSASPPTIFYFADPAQPSEMMECTNTSSGTWTVTRGANGTTPVAHETGFAIDQVVTAATLSALQSPNAGLQFLTGGGNISSTTISDAIAAGYQGIYLDPKYVWTLSSTLVIDSTSNFAIVSDMVGSIAYGGIVSYNDTGYINTGSSGDGIQIYGSSTSGIVFRGCVFVGANSNAVIHYGGKQRRCGLDSCFVYNTGTIATTVASGSNGVNVNTFTGSGTLDVASSASFPSSGQVIVSTANDSSPGLALLSYTGTGSGTLTGVTLISANAGTLSTGGVVAAPQAGVILDTALGDANSENQFLDHTQIASASGICLGIDLASASGHANDTLYSDLVTASGGGLASVVGMGGGGHNFIEYYDRSAASGAPAATVWNNASVLVFRGGEDQNNATTGVVHLVDGSIAVTEIDTRNLSVSTNTAVATVTNGVLLVRGHSRWSGTVNVGGSGTLDLSDPAGYFDNSSSGVLSVSGSAGTLITAPSYPQALAGPPTVSSWTGTTLTTLSAAGVLQPVASTPVAGVSLSTSAQTILTWTAPNDGNLHYATVFGNLHVSSAETGGVIDGVFTDPGGNTITAPLDAGGHGAGTYSFTAKVVCIGAGSTVEVTQAALTAGTALAWAAIWAS